MQRLSQTPLTETNLKATALLSHYDTLQAILLKYLPPSTVSLFAKPELSADQSIVSWYTQLEGQPHLLAQSEDDKRCLAQVQPVIDKRVNDIQALHQDLQHKGLINAEQSRLLSELIEGLNHDTKQIYVINQEPVITAWGIGKVITPPPVPPAQTVTAKPSRSHWWCRLLPLLLLLLGAGLFWWWMQSHQAESPAVETPAPVVAPQSEHAQPESVLEKSLAAPAVEPEPVATPSPTVEPVVEPEPVIEPTPVEETPVEVVGPEPIATPQTVCKTEYSPGEAPQMVIIFDDSASMEYSLLESARAIKEFEYRWKLVGISEAEYQYMTRLPNRLSVAKKTSASLIDNIAKDVDIGLVALKRCPSAQSYGFFSPSKRKTLKNTIKKMAPIEDSGTPLYSGLKIAASMVDGVTRDAFILILSDGEDNCQAGNVCTLAQNLAKKKPKLKINVVDIGGAKAANCIAKATKGKVFTANNPRQLTEMINQAVKPMTETEVCEVKE